MAEKPKKAAGLLVLGEPEEEPASAVAEDAAIDELMAALEAGDREAAKESLKAFVQACMDSY